jgi:hypothetical protein
MVSPKIVRPQIHWLHHELIDASILGVCLILVAPQMVTFQCNVRGHAATLGRTNSHRRSTGQLLAGTTNLGSYYVLALF